MWVQAVAACGLLVLGGCSGGASLNPVDWWHNLEGGPIAAARPPPPNADAPYPNLASVPTGKPANDAAARGQIANALVADRANAQYDAGIAPIMPAAPRPPPPAASDANTSSGTFAAASAPPPPPARPAPAPRTPVQTAVLPPPPAATPAEAATPAATAPMPEMPAQPPAPAALPGVIQTTAPTPPVPTPKPPAVVAAPLIAGASVSIAFPAGRAVLPTSAYAPLTALAHQPGTRSFAVVGFGAAADTSPAAQQSALPLALARARSIAAYLETAGVPAAIIRIDAEADGQGGVARLIH